jgi:hypothetical protein
MFTMALHVLLVLCVVASALASAPQTFRQSADLISDTNTQEDFDGPLPGGGTESEESDGVAPLAIHVLPHVRSDDPTCA